MNPIKKYNELIRSERELIANNIEAVQKSNRILFHVFMGCGICISMTLFIASFFLSAYEPLRYGYLVILFLIGSALLLSRSRALKESAVLYYFFYGLFALFAACSSAFVTPNYVGVMILIFLFEMPIIILDSSFKILIYDAVVVIIYLALVVPNKDPGLVADEIVNTLTFAIIGFATSQFFRTFRLRSMDLARNLNLERTTDALTGLANRRMLFEYFGRYESGLIENPAYAIAIIDIDYFKQYNDAFGHVAGDNCLRVLGKCFQSFGEAHSMDFYRYGGDEFITIIHGEEGMRLVRCLTELNKAVEALNIPTPATRSGIATVSIGVVKINNTDTIVKFEQKIDEADHALYQAKKLGRGITLESTPS